MRMLLRACPAKSVRKMLVPWSPRARQTSFVEHCWHVTMAIVLAVKGEQLGVGCLLSFKHVDDYRREHCAARDSISPVTKHENATRKSGKCSDVRQRVL